MTRTDPALSGVSLALLDIRNIHDGWWQFVQPELSGAPGLREWLFASERGRARMATRLYDRLKMQPKLLDRGSAAAQVLAMGSDAWTRLLYRLGVIWNGRSVARTIDRAAVAEIVQRIGTSGYQRCLDCPDLWGTQTPPATASQLMQSLPLDGALCMKHWISCQPAYLKELSFLRLDPEIVALPSPTSDVVDRACSIVTREVSADG